MLWYAQSQCIVVVVVVVVVKLSLVVVYRRSECSLSVHCGTHNHSSSSDGVVATEFGELGE